MKRFILNPIKYYLYFVFILSVIILINGIMLLDKPMYKIIKGDNIRIGPSSKYEIVRTYRPNHIRSINIESNKRGWHKLKTDFYGQNFLQDMYIWIDNEKSVVDNSITLGKKDFQSYMTFYFNSYDYFYSIINLKYDLDGLIDSNRDIDRNTLGKFISIIFLSSLLSVIIIPIILLMSIFKKNKKIEVSDSKNVDNKTIKEEVNKKQKENTNTLGKESILEKEDKETLQTYFSQKFNEFKEEEIPKIKTILGIDPNYTIENAVRDNNYEVFNTLVKMELIKKGND